MYCHLKCVTPIIFHKKEIINILKPRLQISLCMLGYLKYVSSIHNYFNKSSLKDSSSK